MFNHLKSLPFLKMASRNPTAEMLSYYGFKQEVFDLMQKLSHKSRGFIFNEDGLKGFLVVDPLIIDKLLAVWNCEEMSKSFSHQFINKEKFEGHFKNI